MDRPEKKPVGRPPKPLPEPIDDEPERVAWALLNTPPKQPDEWKYLRDGEPD